MSPSTPPLVVDLDGTLVKTDVLIEAWFALLKRRPLRALVAPLWLLQGRARLKQRIARWASLDAGGLPYHRALVDYLRTQHDGGRRLVLATAADAALAHAVADHLGLFEAVFASDGEVNLSGERKRERLRLAFGDRGYDYAGNGHADLPVWAAARRGILVNTAQRVRAAAERLVPVERVFDDRGECLRSYLRALRVHQWVKNLLVFVPLLAAHRIGDLPLLGREALALVAFSLCASGAYVLNDLLDLGADRRHPSKRHRPFACGELPPVRALVVFPALMGAGVGVGLLLGPAPAAVVSGYVVLTLAYSLRLKRMVLLDVPVLAGLYTLRVVAGSAAAAIRARAPVRGPSSLSTPASTGSARTA